MARFLNRDPVNECIQRGFVAKGSGDLEDPVKDRDRRVDGVGWIVHKPADEIENRELKALDQRLVCRPVKGIPIREACMHEVDKRQGLYWTGKLESDGLLRHTARRQRLWKPFRMESLKHV
jgi:hypothetical protein